MLVRRISVMIAAAGMAFAPVANAASAPVPARVAAPMAEQDSEHLNTTMGAILAIIVVLLIGIAAISGDGEPKSP